MASTDSIATFVRVFPPPIWRSNQSKSQEENAASFRVYVTDMTKNMNSHLEFLEKGISRVKKGKKEKGESSRKRKRGVERDNCGEWPVIIVDSESDKMQDNPKDGGETEGKGEDAKEENEAEKAAEEKADESKEVKEDTSEEEDTEEDEETDENAKSDLNSDSITRSEEKNVVKSDASFESESYDYDDDDDDSDAKSDSGNYHEANEETSEDSSMFAMKIPD